MIKKGIQKEKLLYGAVIVVLAACIVRVLWTTYFYKVAYTTDGSADAWWYEPQMGWSKRQLKGAFVSMAIMVVNALPFLQWKRRSWRLPIYDYKPVWLRRIFAPFNWVHWFMFLVVFPLCTWAYYGTAASAPWPYASGEIAYGYHPDDFVDFWFLSLGMFGLCWTLLHEGVLLLRTIFKKK